jgi:predicted methyltransferase
MRNLAHWPFYGDPIMNKKTSFAAACLTFALLIATGFAPYSASTAHAHDVQGLLDKVIQGTHRSDANRARDQYRHPKETLLFFGLKPEMTVVEISPANGWYTEIIGPILKQQGRYFPAVPILTDDMPEAMKRRDTTYRQMLKAAPELYGEPTITTYDAAAPVFAPAGTADLVVTFRNVHNWAKAGHTQSMFKGFFQALKPGGVLGVVEHRAKPDTPLSKQIESGYMTEQFVIEVATAAGFRLERSSEINSNALDTKDHPGGVWTLPPNLRGVAESDKLKYRTIGESDRMTLRFVKP